MLTRRALLAVAAAGLAAPGSAIAAPPSDSFERLIEEARQLARAAYVPPGPVLPAPLAALDFDSWRRIRFRAERSPIAEGPYRLQLFHRGFLHQDAVAISLAHEAGEKAVSYDPKAFEFDGVLDPSTLPPDLGVAGFKLLTALNGSEPADEVISFLGASYFRFLSRGQHYGLSARAIAVNAGLDGVAEEFPAFRKAIIHSPEADGSITIDLLLDGPSLAAAFCLHLAPGAPSGVTVRMHLVARSDIEQLGLAPLTSMFLHGEGDPGKRGDYRPELHDSDGLLMQAGSGEWLWRPLKNPEKLTVSRFSDTNPKGFGLMQRDRVFAHYQDLDLNYHRRPGYWVEPLGDWGAGTVDLIELPTADETNDNIVAFWQPDRPLAAGAELRLDYRLTAQDGTKGLSPGGFAVNSFRTLPKALGSAEKVVPGSVRFLVDFAGGGLDRVEMDALALDVTATNGRIIRQFLLRNPEIGGVRAVIDVAGPVGETIDLRAFVKQGPDILTETWTFPWIAG